MIKIILFLFTIIYQTNAIDDFWVVWRYKSETRCKELGQSEENCELYCDIIEEQIMETAYPLYTKMGHKGETITKRSLDIPFVLNGQRLIDKYLHILMTEKDIPENDLANRMYWELTLFVMDCMMNDEENAWQRIKDDEFWKRKESKEYLKSIGVDLDKIVLKSEQEQKEEEKEKKMDDIEKEKQKLADSDDWSEFDEAKKDL